MPERRVLSDEEFTAEWFRYFGKMKGVHYLGWALLLAAEAGVRGEDALSMRERLVRNGAGRSTAFKVLAKLREFGEDLERRGLWLDSWEGAKDVDALASRAVRVVPHSRAAV